MARLVEQIPRTGQQGAARRDRRSRQALRHVRLTHTRRRAGVREADAGGITPRPADRQGSAQGAAPQQAGNVGGVSGRRQRDADGESTPTPLPCRADASASPPPTPDPVAGAGAGPPQVGRRMRDASRPTRTTKPLAASATSAARHYTCARAAWGGRRLNRKQNARDRTRLRQRTLLRLLRREPKPPTLRTRRERRRRLKGRSIASPRSS